MSKIFFFNTLIHQTNQIPSPLSPVFAQENTPSPSTSQKNRKTKKIHFFFLYINFFYSNLLALRRETKQRRRRSKHVRACLRPKKNTAATALRPQTQIVVADAVANTETTTPKHRLRRAALQNLNGLRSLLGRSPGRRAPPPRRRRRVRRPAPPGTRRWSSAPETSLRHIKVSIMGNLFGI